MASSTLTSQDISNSLSRLQKAFAGDYGRSPLYEGSRPVGCVSRDDHKIYLTFRGSIDSLSELLSCLDLRKFSTNKWGLAGRVHAGLHSSFSKVQQSIDAYISHSFPNKSLQGVNIVLEGYSRGSALAMLTAAYLTHQFAADRLTVITYSPLNIFDKVAAKAYKEKIKNQWNFVCTRDFVPRWIGSSCLGFCPSGDRIEFAPEESPSFLERIRKQAYTHLIRHWLIGTILRLIIPLRLWEAHMPETYQDGSIAAFAKRTMSPVK